MVYLARACLCPLACRIAEQRPIRPNEANVVEIQLGDTLIKRENTSYFQQRTICGEERSKDGWRVKRKVGIVEERIDYE